MLLVSGVLSNRLWQEIPQYLDWFRMASYLLLITLAVHNLFL